MNGKLTDVIIEEETYKDDVGLAHFMNFKVWMDKSAAKAVKNIPGVEGVYNPLGGNEYHVYLDPRYDREYLRKEIEAQAKINSEG